MGERLADAVPPGVVLLDEGERLGPHRLRVADLAVHGTPLITDDPDDPDSQRALLAFVAPPHTAGVYAWVNRLTDGPHLGRGQLRRWGSTDLWWTELVVARGTMATYRFYPYAADDPHLRDGVLAYSRAVAQAYFESREALGFPMLKKEAA